VLVFRFSAKVNKVLCSVALFIMAFSAGSIVVGKTNIITVLFAYISIYQVINILKIVENRVNEKYLFSAAKKTFAYLTLAQLLILVIWVLFELDMFTISVFDLLACCGVIILFLSIILAANTLKNIYSTKGKQNKVLGEYSLPTLTLAIAARNEDKALVECLEAAVASNYSKLEILVYDDCSQDKTPQLIRDFAQKGVRFVKGHTEEDGWLSKNKAYQVLLDQASGDFVMYMGVDVSLGQDTIRKVVEFVADEKLSMISIMPKRTKSGLAAAFIQPMRYWWELAMPRWILRRPPVLSTCWVINKKVLIEMGGFKSVKRAIIPEEHIAYAQSKIGKYRFIRNSADIGITTEKDFSSQWSTAVRTRYPQLHRRPELVALRSLIMLTVLLSPFAYVLFSIISNNYHWLNFAIAFSSLALLTLSNVLISLVTNPAATIMALLNFPINVIIELIALHISMYRYEFAEVIWKGRNVSNVAMHVYNRLPKI
jgi:glycosyltransferase involved in cell wall biosynthesis